MAAMKRLGDKELGVLAVVAASLTLVALMTAAPELLPRQGSSPALAGGRYRPLVLKPSPVPPPSATLDAMSVDEFLGLMGGSAPAPVAEKFTRAFLKERPLREAWEQSKREKGEKGPALDFLRRVARLPQFRQLMNEFHGAPGFQQAFLRLTSRPELNAALRGALAGEYSASASTARAAVARSRSNAASRQFTSDSSRRSVSTGLPGPGAPLSTRAGGLRDAAASSLASAPVGAASPLNSDPEAGTSSSLEGRQGDDDAYALRTLSQVSSAGSSREAGSFLDSLFATAPKDLRDALLYQCEVNDICEPVAACMATNRFDDCVAACAENPACSGRGLLSPGPENGEVARGDAVGVSIVSEKPKSLRHDKDIGKALDGGATLNDPTSCPTPDPAGGDGGALGGELAGGVIGAIAGGLIGSALGPAGTLIGGAVGGAIGAGFGGFIADALGNLLAIGG